MSASTASAPASAPAAQAPPALTAIPRQVWRIAMVIIFGAFMAGLDTSLINVGLDTVGDELHSSLATTQWITSGYLIALAAALPACAWLGRRFGSGRLWMAALAGFTVTSTLCAVVPNTGLLILARVLQGAAGGLLIPSGQAVLGRAAGPKSMGRVMNTVGIAVVAAPALGPVLGGLIITHLDWRYLFLVNLPVGLIAMALGARIVPKGEKGQAGPFDLPGLLLLGAGLPLISYGVIDASNNGAVSLGPLLATLLPGVAALAGYGWRSLHRQAPLLDLHLYTDRVYTAAQVAVFFCGATLFGGLIVAPLYFELLRNESTISTGLLLISYGVGAMASMRVGGRLTDRVGGGLTCAIGMALTIASTLPFVFFDAHAGMVWVEVLMFVRGTGVSLCGVPAMSAAYARVRRDKLPDATSQVQIVHRIGGSLGTALFVVALYDHGVTSTHSFRVSFAWLTGSSVLALIAALWLTTEQRRARVREQSASDAPRG